MQTRQQVLCFLSSAVSLLRAFAALLIHVSPAYHSEEAMSLPFRPRLVFKMIEAHTQLEVISPSVNHASLYLTQTFAQEKVVLCVCKLQTLRC